MQIRLYKKQYCKLDAQKIECRVKIIKAKRDTVKKIVPIFTTKHPRLGKQGVYYYFCAAFIFSSQP